MSKFVHCRGCGTQIHETAVSCPQCGAPQAAAATATTAAALGAVPARASPYGSIPWFRRRWFIILCLVFMSPVAAFISASGDMYYATKSGIQTFSRDFKIATWFSAYLTALAILEVAADEGGLAQLGATLFGVLLIVLMAIRR